MKKTILLALFALIFMANTNAQTTCATAINAAAGTNQAPAQNEFWYAFSPNGQPLASYSIGYDSKSFDVSVTIYSGACGNLQRLSSSQIPAIPNDANTYYIQFVWNSGTPQAFEWMLSQNLVVPMTGISVTPENVNLAFGQSFRIDNIFTINRLPDNTTEYPSYEVVLLDYEGILKNQIPDMPHYAYTNSTLQAVGSGTAKLVFNALVFKDNVPVSAGLDTVTVNIAAPALCASATAVNTGANTAQAEQEEWFRFTPSKTGIYTINHEDVTPGGDKISVDWAIYKGDCDNLRAIEGAYRQFQAEAGQTYSIKLYQDGSTAFDWTLEEPKNVTGFSLTTKQLELTLPDGSYDLANLGLNFIPADATDKGVDIAVRDADVIELSEDGQATVYKDAIRALKEGSTYAVFTTRDGGFKDSCLVTVKSVPLTSFSLSMHEKTLWLPYSQTGEYVNINDTSALKVIYTPANATDKSYSVAVRKKGIVRYDGYGMQALREGSTYVVFTANDGGLQDSILVNVTRTVSGGSPCESATVAQLGDNTQPVGEGYTQWYAFTPAESGNYALTNHTTKYPLTGVEIYEGSCGDLYLIKDGRIQGGYEQDKSKTGNTEFDCGELYGYQAGFYGASGATYYLKLTTETYNMQGGAFEEPVPYPWTLGKVSASLSGTVTDNGAPAQGEVELYAYRGQNEAVLQERADIQANGSYTFSNLGVEQYFVKAVTATGGFAYSGNTQEWKSAGVVLPRKSEAYTGIDIAVVRQEPVNEGTAKISGYVFNSEEVQANTIRRATSLRSSSGNPAANITVLLQRNASAVNYTRTNAEGYFEFTGVGTGEYVVVIDIPGLEMEELTTVNITEDAQSVELAYEVNEAGIFDNTTAIETVSRKTDVRIYPNPVSDGFFVRGIHETAALRLINLSGNVILSKPVSDGEYVSVSSLAGGIYIVRLLTGNGTMEQKLIKR